MPAAPTLHQLRTALAAGDLTPTALAQSALAHSNRSASRNTYLWQDPAFTLAEAARAEAIPRISRGPFNDGRHPLWGLPISLKDCFDLATTPTTCGSRSYAQLHGPASHDSWLAAHLRAAGAVLTGKTHLHPLAYGITGENPDFGDSLQPNDPTALTGGSSSGAAASIQEGSAAMAIGTDTGGSIRVPAALCGLAGYRATHSRGNWAGAAHLAPSFDTMGCLFAHLSDAPLFASLFAPDHPAPAATPFTHVAAPDDSFFHDCDPAIVASFHSTLRDLQSLGLTVTRFDASWWSESYDIFAPIQASEAAQLHAGRFPHIQPDIRQRLEWGASLTPSDLATLRARHQAFNARMDALFATHQLVLLPAAPVTRLPAHADHSQTRARLLRYTTPFSLAGVPAVTLPCAAGGMQLAAARHHDEPLLTFAARLATNR